MLTLSNAVLKKDAQHSVMFQFPVSSPCPAIFNDSLRGFLSTTATFYNLRNSLFGNHIPFHVTSNLSTENVLK